MQSVCLSGPLGVSYPFSFIGSLPDCLSLVGVLPLVVYIPWKKDKGTFISMDSIHT